MPNDIRDAIRAGDVDRVSEMLAADATLVHARLDGQRTLLHVATDWPGHFPNARRIIRLLVAAGADVNAPFQGGRHSERPLHWAASSDDLEALDALLDGGADIEAPGSVIDGGTALSDSVAFAQWKTARRLVERGAACTLWQAAALGLMERLTRFLGEDPPPSAEAVTNAFWNACHGGQLAAAQFLLQRGADPTRIGHDRLTPFAAAARNGSVEVLEWLRSEGIGK